METSLHQALKQLYCTAGARTEARVHGYRVDVLQGEVVIEVQSSPLGAIAGKVSRLLERGPVVVVKPIRRRRMVVWLSSRGGAELSRRWSPKQGRLIDVFDDLVQFTRVFPHRNLRLDVLLVDEEEHRVRRGGWRRRRAYTIVDRRLRAVCATHRLRRAGDLLNLLPTDLPPIFTSRRLAHCLGVPEWTARQVAYTLRHCGAARQIGKRGRFLLYALAAPQGLEPAMMVAC